MVGLVFGMTWVRLLGDNGGVEMGREAEMERWSDERSGGLIEGVRSYGAYVVAIAEMPTAAEMTSGQWAEPRTARH